jgi:hypothetical protein
MMRPNLGSRTAEEEEEQYITAWPSMITTLLNPLQQNLSITVYIVHIVASGIAMERNWGGLVPQGSVVEAIETR